MSDRTRAARLVGLLASAIALLAVGDLAAASNVASGLSGGRDLRVPTWLYLFTGGAAVGASGLLATFVTDRRLVAAAHERSLAIPVGDGASRAARHLLGVAGVVALALGVYVGLAGPQVTHESFAVLLTFVGARAGLTMAAYLLANPWPALNPWRRLAEALPGRDASYPERLGVWPAVAGLLVLLWIELVVPLTERPSTLAAVVLVYSAYTLAGALTFSPDAWFRYADPVAVLFRYYGLVAPIGRTDDGFELRLPGARLREPGAIDGLGGVAFALLLVWDLTFSGLVVTSPGATAIRAAVGAGAPPSAVYLGLLLAGYALLVATYWLAARGARRIAETYLDASTLAIRFAPPLLAIAAGYHLAHYFAFFLSLSPALWGVLANPLAPPSDPVVIVLPGWFGSLEAAFVLVGHLLAIWTAHAASFATFPGRLQAIRSQYPFVGVMILYTVVSLWLLSLPTAPPPYVGSG